jgi:hypothetical protein
MIEHSKEPGIARLHRLVQYAKGQKVELHPSLQAYHAPGHGLGVHATGVIEVGNKIALTSRFVCGPLMLWFAPFCCLPDLTFSHTRPPGRYSFDSRPENCSFGFIFNPSKLLLDHCKKIVVSPWSTGSLHRLRRSIHKQGWKTCVMESYVAVI